MNKIIIIKEKNQDQRLDHFLTEKLKNQSRSQIKKMIENGLVLVNSEKSKVHHFLKTGEKITILPLAKTEAKGPVTEKKTSTAPKPNTIFENDNFLILEKPAGLLVHQTELGEAETLVSWLHEKYPEIENVGEYKYRGGIIHRLDRDVSGVIVVAKNDHAFYYLKDQFKERAVKKIYLALVYGHIDKPEGEINLPIGRNKDGQFVAHPKKGVEKFLVQDKLAKTKYKVLEYIKDYTLLEIQILTGRTHQIRAHFQAIGHPILGDQIYKPKKKIFNFLRRRIKVIDPGRIFLHSHRIGFNNLKNDWVEFTSPLPEKLTDFLNESRQKLRR